MHQKALNFFFNYEMVEERETTIIPSQNILAAPSQVTNILSVECCEAQKLLNISITFFLSPFLSFNNIIFSPPLISAASIIQGAKGNIIC